MENNTNVNELPGVRDHRLRRYAELGITEENAAQLKALLEANGYKVDLEYYVSIQPIYKNWNDQPRAHLVFSNDLIEMSTSGSYWEFGEAKRFQREVNTCIDLMEQIEVFAPNLIDKTFRDQRRQKESEEAKVALQAKVDAFNAMPKTEVLLEPAGGAKVVLNRDQMTYEYASHYGRRDSFPASLSLFTKNGEEKHFSPSSYITRSGSVQHKKFKEQYESILGEEDIDSISIVLLSLAKKLAKARSGN